MAVLRVFDDGGELTPELEGVGGANVGGDMIDGVVFDRYFAGYLGLNASEERLGFNLPNRVRVRMRTRAGLVRLATERAIYELIDRGVRSKAGPEMARLRDLIFGGFGFGFYEAIEAAKCDLSKRTVSAVRFRGGSLDVDQPLRRSELKAALAPILTAVHEAISDALTSAGKGPDAINTVLLTGGSSQLSAFQDLVRKRFPTAHIVTGDTYTSVARGLATIAPQFFGGPA